MDYDKILEENPELQRWQVGHDMEIDEREIFSSSSSNNSSILWLLCYGFPLSPLVSTSWATPSLASFLTTDVIFRVLKTTTLVWMTRNGSNNWRRTNWTRDVSSSSSRGTVSTPRSSAPPPCSVTTWLTCVNSMFMIAASSQRLLSRGLILSVTRVGRKDS